MVQILEAERWPALLGHMLPLLIACQRLAGDAALLPHSCLQLLGLPPGAAADGDRRAALEELLASLGAAAEPEGARLDALPALAVAPARGRWSNFYGSEAGPDSAPVLAPPARPAARGSKGSVSSNARGAALVNAGDALQVEVEVFSNLPAPVVLARPALVLARYAKAPSWPPPGGGAAAAAPAAAAAAAAGMLSPLAGAGGGLVGNAARLAAAARRGSMGGAAGAAAAAALAGGDGGSATASGDSMGGPAAAWVECEELVCTRLVAAEPLPLPRRDGSDGDGSGGGGSRVEGRGAGAALRLAPGLTRVVFEAAPSREGLYALKHLRAALGGALVVAGVPDGGRQPALRSKVRPGREGRRAVEVGFGAAAACCCFCSAPAFTHPRRAHPPPPP
jgi:hypothetical protein